MLVKAISVLLCVLYVIASKGSENIQQCMCLFTKLCRMHFNSFIFRMLFSSMQ